MCICHMFFKWNDNGCFKCLQTTHSRIWHKVLPKDQQLKDGPAVRVEPQDIDRAVDTIRKYFNTSWQRHQFLIVLTWGFEKVSNWDSHAKIQRFPLQFQSTQQHRSACMNPIFDRWESIFWHIIPWIFLFGKKVSFKNPKPKVSFKG